MQLKTAVIRIKRAAVSGWIERNDTQNQQASFAVGKTKDLFLEGILCVQKTPGKIMKVTLPPHLARPKCLVLRRSLLRPYLFFCFIRIKKGNRAKRCKRLCPNQRSKIWSIAFIPALRPETASLGRTPFWPQIYKINKFLLEACLCFSALLLRGSQWF